MNLLQFVARNFTPIVLYLARSVSILGCISLMAFNALGNTGSAKSSEADKLSVFDMFKEAEWAFLENPNPKTFAALSPSFQEQVLGAVLIELYRAEKTGEIPAEIRAMQEIIRSELPKREGDSLKRINESAFAAVLTTNASESFPAALQVQLAIQHLKLASQGDLQAFQETFCNGITQLFSMNGIKRTETSSQITYNAEDSSALSSQRTLIINVITQSGIHWTQRCLEPINKDDEKSPKVASNILEVLNKLLPEVRPYFKSEPHNTKHLSIQSQATNADFSSKDSFLCSELELRCLLRDPLHSMSQQKGYSKTFLGLNSQRCQISGRLEKSARGHFLLSSLFTNIRDPGDILFREIDDLVFSMKAKKRLRASDPQDRALLNLYQSRKILDCRRIFSEKPQDQTSTNSSVPRSSAPPTADSAAGSPGGAIFFPFSAK